MSKYIFVTAEGETVSPNGGDAENLQVIGFVENAKDKDEALEILLEENAWIKEYGFDPDNFKIYQIL